MAAEYSQDRQIVRGLDALINKDLVAPGANLIDVERALINETPDYKQRQTPEPLNDLIRDIGEQYSLDIADIVGDDVRAAPHGGAAPHSSAAPQRSAPTYSAYSASPPNVRSSASVLRSPQVYDDDDDDDDDVPDDLYSRENINDGYTREQRHRSNFNSIIAHDSKISDRVEIENEEDEKAELLADIELLLSALEADGVPIERLEQAKPTMSSSYRQVQSFARGLQKKVDKNRGSALIEESVIFAVSLLEDFFDGNNEYFGYRPDLTGYSNTARTKMRRLRPESAVLASSVLHSSSMGPGTRMMFELLPSMVLHSRARRQQHGEAGIFDDSSMVTANTEIRRHS